MLAILIPLVIIVAGVATADIWARGRIAEPIREAVAAGFRVAPESVEVDLGGEIAILQYINGRVERVSATIPSVVVAGATTDVVVELRGVPIDRSLPVVSLDARVVFGAEDLEPLLAETTGLAPEAIEIGDRDIRFDTDLDLGIVGVFPVGVELRPSAGPGSVSFSPVAIDLNGTRVEAADIRTLPILGEFIAPAIASREYCLADRFPMDLAIERFVAADGGLELVLGGTAVVADEESLARPGLCA